MGLKVTEQEFAYYRKRVLLWIDKFSLKQWQVDFSRIDRAESCARANCIFNSEGMWATFGFAKELGTIVEWPKWPHNKADIDSDAYHEVMELLLAELTIIMNSRYNVSEVGIDGAKHRVVATLENIVRPLFKEAILHQGGALCRRCDM